MLILAVLLAVVCGVLLVLWRRAEADARTYAAAARAANQRSREQELLIRHLCEELDALSITPPAAVAALQPDDPSLLPDEIEQWLRDRTPTIRPSFPEES